MPNSEEGPVAWEARVGWVTAPSGAVSRPQGNFTSGTRRRLAAFIGCGGGGFGWSVEGEPDAFFRKALAAAAYSHLVQISCTRPNSAPFSTTNANGLGIRK